MRTSCMRVTVGLLDMHSCPGVFCAKRDQICTCKRGVTVLLRTCQSGLHLKWSLLRHVFMSRSLLRILGRYAQHLKRDPQHLKRDLTFELIFIPQHWGERICRSKRQVEREKASEKERASERARARERAGARERERAKEGGREGGREGGGGRARARAKKGQTLMRDRCTSCGCMYVCTRARSHAHTHTRAL
jgi:hypothetical protein